jgi:hypothetical protein
VAGKPPLLSELTAEQPLKLHAWCHLAALALITVGILADVTLLIRIGAAVGAVGAVAFGWFAYLLLRRLFFFSPADA